MYWDIMPPVLSTGNCTSLKPQLHTFKKDRKLHKIKTAERLQNVKGATEGDIMLLHAIHADKVFAEYGVKGRIIIKSPDTDV
jgi:hypothetical protein